jgi:phosphatidylglycerol:prolipoprotein diacylglycerol transferase
MLGFYYIHNLDPVILDISGPIAIRWYGVSYLMGFVAAYFLLRFLSKRAIFPVPVVQMQNFVIMLAFFGVFVGGRLGYVLLYGFQDLVRDPLMIFRVWEGGMASHGGMAAVLIFLACYAKKHKYQFWHLADNVSCVVPIGLGLGRIANFINGELWGRPTTVSWAMIFPQELQMNPVPQLTKEMAMDLMEQGLLFPRHPSQLYEAIGEGLILFAILWYLRFHRWSKHPSFLSVVFLIGYAFIRITVEFFREPDSTVFWGWMTKGQLFSLFMIALALVFIYYNLDAVKKRRNLVRSFKR